MVDEEESGLGEETAKAAVDTTCGLTFNIRAQIRLPEGIHDDERRGQRGLSGHKRKIWRVRREEQPPNVLGGGKPVQPLFYDDFRGIELKVEHPPESRRVAKEGQTFPNAPGELPGKRTLARAIFPVEQDNALAGDVGVNQKRGVVKWFRRKIYPRKVQKRASPLLRKHVTSLP